MNKNKNTNTPDGYEISDKLVNKELEHKLKIFHGPAGQAIITDNYGLQSYSSTKTKTSFLANFFFNTVK